MQRTTIARWCLVVMLLGAVGAAAGVATGAPTMAQGSLLPAELSAGPPRGITLSILASQELDETSRDPFSRILQLIRWQLQPGEQRGTLAPVLGYVEEGEVTVVSPVRGRDEGTYGKGASFTTTPEDSLLRNDGSGCAWVLLVQYYQGEGAAGSTDEPGPQLGQPIPCDNPEELLASGAVPQGEVGGGTEGRAGSGSIGWVPEPPALLFLARKTWEPGADSGIHRHSGPVAIAVESGRLLVGGPGSFGSVLRPGSAIAVAAGAPFREANPAADAAATALVVGVVAASEEVRPVRGEEYDDQGLSNLSSDAASYEDPVFGWSIGWDLSWSVLAAPQRFPSDSLRLANGRSEVALVATSTEEGDAEACVSRRAGEKAQESGVAAFGPARDEAGAPMRNGDADRFTAVFLGIDSGGVQTAWVLQCRRLGGASGMLELEWTVPFASYNDELPRVTALLDGLRLPT